MSRINAFVSGVLAAASACLFLSTAPAHALQQSTWVSATGSDSKDCSTAANACATIEIAIGRTISGGVVNVLEGTYNGINITQAIQVVGHGRVSVGIGSNVCPGGGISTCSGIAVQAGAADEVRIRGVIVDSAVFGSSNTAAIIFVSGAALHLEDCTLVDGAYGLYVSPNVAAANGRPTSITVKNCGIDSNASGNVLITPRSSVAVNALLDKVTLTGSAYGVRAENSNGGGKIRVDVTESVANNAVDNGFLAVGTGSSPVHFFVDRSTASGNGAYGAVATGAEGFMIVSNSVLIGNATGLGQLSGSTVASYTNNSINFNETNTTGTITTLPLK